MSLYEIDYDDFQGSDFPQSIRNGDLNWCMGQFNDRQIVGQDTKFDDQKTLPGVVHFIDQLFSKKRDNDERFGFLEASRMLYDTFMRSKESFTSPENIIISHAQNELVDELRDIFDECLKENWDGYNASPITEKTYSMSSDTIHLLENELSNELLKFFEVSPGADGSIIFEYRKTANSIFTVSVKENSDIIFIFIDIEKNIRINCKAPTSEIRKLLLKFKDVIFN